MRSKTCNMCDDISLVIDKYKESATQPASMTTAPTAPTASSGVVIDLTGTLGLSKDAASASDFSTQRRVRHLFHFPAVVLADPTGAEGDESSLLLDERKKRAPRECGRCDAVARVTWAICPLVTTLLMAAILAVVVVVFQKLDAGVKTIDATVDLTSTASSMLSNVNSMLSSTASLARTADKLGLKAINLTYVLGPFAKEMMNKTEHIIGQVDTLTSHPTISLG